MEETPAGTPKRPSLARRLRGFARGDEISLIVLGVVVGAAAGFFAAAILRAALFLHEHLYGLTRLSAMDRLASPWQALIPALGGLLVGLSLVLARRWRPGRPVDPIEANALRGGEMSLADSAVIVAQTTVSNGFGASVGLEAAYTQMGSGFASFLGKRVGLRRADLRTLVGCGAAGAIAAAFSAPLTGAFYAFELVLGSYTPFGLAPVCAAAVAGATTARLFGAAPELVKIPDPAVTVGAFDAALLLGLAAACALFGVAIMRCATFVEKLFQRTRLPLLLHPVVGGLIVGALAIFSPHVLSSGHEAALDLFGEDAPERGVLAATILAKAAAAAVSVGSSFRGGLFFASLYLGALSGWLFALVEAVLMPYAPIDGWTSALIGMVSLAVAVVGGPLTMSFLALEATRNLSLSLFVLAASALSSLIVRRAFGYSFATWRLHLRGESIRGAQDVGWMRDLTVGRLMRRDVDCAPVDAPLDAVAALYPLGAAQWIAAIDGDGSYRGLVFLPDAHLRRAEAGGETPLGVLARLPDLALAPQMNAQAAARLFERAECEALAVLDERRRVVGLLTEGWLLRRYAQALETARRDLAGDPGAREAE